MSCCVWPGGVSVWAWSRCQQGTPIILTTLRSLFWPTTDCQGNIKVTTTLLLICQMWNSRVYGLFYCSGRTVTYSVYLHLYRPCSGTEPTPTYGTRMGKLHWTRPERGVMKVTGRSYRPYSHQVRLEGHWKVIQSKVKVTGSAIVKFYECASIHDFSTLSTNFNQMYQIWRSEVIGS